MRLEKTQYTTNVHTAGAFGLRLRFILLLATATMLLTPAVNVLAQQAGTDAIRPFRVNFPKAALDDLRRRIAATRWPEQDTVTDGSQGVQLAMLKKLASYRATDYDWLNVETKLNALPQFIKTIVGVDIHFIHVKSRHANALPIIITHGWPGSVIEQLKVIGPLTDPTAYG